MKCAICGISIDSIEELIDKNWVQSFYDGDAEHGPVCFSCSEKLLYIASDGEYEIREKFKGRIVFNDQVIEYEEDPVGCRARVYIELRKP